MAGAIEIDEMVFEAAVTVREAEPVTPFRTAVTVAEPAATPLTMPLPLTVAMVESETAQAATELISAVVLSLYVALALNCWVAPAVTLADEGEIVMEFTDLAV